MGMLITKSTHGAVNANDQRTDRFYIMKFLLTVYMLQHDELVDKEILKAGSLVSDAEYMSPAMKDNVDIVTSTSDLDYSMSTVAQEHVIQKEPFKLSADDYDNILD
eukprot:1278825-Ditylum_brightwellii.AAC.1